MPQPPEEILVSFLLLALVLLGAGAMLCGIMVWLLARSLAMPPRMTDGKAIWVLRRLSPGDLGLEFEEIAFDVRDAGAGKPLRIAGWWIPHPHAHGRCVILLHGYADAKVGAIAWAPTWHALGWNILAIDLRAHGESGGRFCTGGYFERDDVSQVIDMLCSLLPDQTKQIVLFGASFGAAVAVATAAQREDIEAVVLDSPVPDFPVAAMLQMERLGAPGGLLRRFAVRLTEWMTGGSFGEVRLLDLLPTLKCAVFVIAPEHDPLLGGDMRDALRQAARDGEFWQVEDAGHLLTLPADPHRYQTRLAEFLETVPARSSAQ